MYKKSSDKMNELYAACSYWDSEFLGVRQRLEKEASVSNKILAGMAGGAAGYYTSDEKSKSSTKLLRAAGGAALGAGGAHLYHKYKKGAPAKPKDLTQKIEEILNKKNPSEADIKTLNKLRERIKAKMDGPHGFVIKEANAALVGAGVMGAVGGVRAYQRHKLSPGQKYTKAEFEAMQSTRALEEKSKAGLKVSILDRKLNDLKVQDAREGRQSLRGAVVKGATRGAATGALAGFLASKGMK